MNVKSIAIGLLISIFVLSGCGMLSSGPSTTVEDFFSAVEDGEIDKAESLFSIKVRRQFGDKLKEGLRQQTRRMQSQGGLKSIEVLDEEKVGEIATVTVEITMGNGESAVEKIDLVKEEGEWKLDPKPQK